MSAVLAHESGASMGLFDEENRRVENLMTLPSMMQLYL
jgi:hypothetical protein